MIRKAIIFFLPISILFAAAVMAIAAYSGRQVPVPVPLSPLWIAVLIATALLLLVLLTWLAARSIFKPLDKLSETMQLFLDGNWEQRASAEALQASSGLGKLFNQMADELADMQRSMTLRKEDNGAGARQALIKLGGLFCSDQDLDEVLSQALEVIVERFECDYGAIYQVERAGAPGGKRAVRRHGYGEQEFLAAQLPGRIQTQTIQVESIKAKDWPIAQAITSGHSRVGSLQFERDSEVNKVFEAAIPIIQSGRVLAAIDLYTLGRRAESRLGPFSTRTISELEAFANIIAAAMDKPFETSPLVKTATQLPSQAEARILNLLYQAGQQTARARTRSQALSIVSNALQQTPYEAAILLANGERLEPAYPEGTDQTAGGAVLEAGVWVPSKQTAQFFASANPETEPFLILNALEDSRLPQGLRAVCRQMGFNSAAFIPVRSGFGLDALLILGENSNTPNGNGAAAILTLSFQELGPYKYLIEQLASALERMQLPEDSAQGGAELQTLWKISQAIAVETDLDSLYRTIHQQVVAYMGELSSFAIALYEAATNTIQIPYMFEEGKSIDVPPFPLGEGLTSIVIHTGEPLMIVENAQQQAEALGAKTMGEPAKSWMGVPLLYRGEAIGVMMAQDIQHEHRFNQEDQRLFSAMANQIAVIVRNSKLYQTSQKYARHERLVYKIGDRIRQSTEINTILKTTAEELGAALNLDSARIELQVEQANIPQESPAEPNNNGSAPDPGQNEESAV